MLDVPSGPRESPNRAAARRQVVPSVLGRGESPLRSLLLSSVVSVLIGFGVVVLATLDSERRPPPAVYLAGAVIGLSINLCALLLEHVLLARLRRELAQLVRPLAYFVGGIAGYLLGNLLASGLGLSPAVEIMGPRPGRTLLFFGLLAVGVGLTFSTVGTLRERLRQSVIQLKEHEFAEKELELARGLQQRLLPPPEITGDRYLVAARNVPARFVAGDFYDVFPMGDGAMGLVVGDVSGKGISASLVVAQVMAMLPLLVVGRSVAGTLQELNRRLFRELPSREFVALSLVRFEPATGRCTMANAGLPDGYLLASEELPRAVAVPGPRLPLGVRDEVAYEEAELSLGARQRLLLLSDGLPEAALASGEPIGYGALLELLQHHDPAPGELLDRVFLAVAERTVKPQDDDWTALVLEASTGPEPPP